MKIAIIENSAKDFFKSRLRFSKFLISKGYTVYAIVPADEFYQMTKVDEINVIYTSGNIRNISLFRLFNYFIELLLIFKKYKFDIVHTFRFQPNIIGCFAAKITGVKKIIGHITGLGIAFTYSSFKYLVLRYISIILYRFNNNFLNIDYIVQNYEDYVDLGLNRLILIKGSSINESIYIPKKNQFKPKKNKSKIRLLFASRLLKSKGIIQLIESIKILPKNISEKIILEIAGEPDYSNFDSINKEDLGKMKLYPFINLLGYRNDINKLILKSDICVLPTAYREGTPRFLLQAMASAKPIITTSMPGCNHLIENGLNGFVFNAHDVDRLSSIIQDLEKYDLKKMGENSLRKYRDEFSEKIVFNLILSNYK